MLQNQLKDRLSQMRLKGLLDAYLKQQSDPAIKDLSFEERFGLLIDFEWTNRQNHRLKRLLKESGMSGDACIEDIDFTARRNLDRKLIQSLSNCDWLLHHQNIMIFGPTGVGKTYLSCALGQAACRMDYSVRYFRVSKLMEKLQVAHGDGTYFKFFSSLKRAKLLILDDWGLKPLSSAECSEILELFEDRFNNGSTIISSQLPLEHWDHALSDPTLADAILDRVVHNAHKIFLKGDSMRKTKSTLASSDDKSSDDKDPKLEN
jgi:DNA replication protein DnaC